MLQQDFSFETISTIIYQYFQLNREIEKISIDLELNKEEIESILNTFKNTFTPSLLNINLKTFVSVDPDVFPEIYVKEFHQLRDLYETKQYYGVFLQIKDIYELLLKYPLIIYISILTKNKQTYELSNEEREMLQFFFSTKLSLGSWRNISNHIIEKINNTGREYEVVVNILTSINEIYKNHNIVNWRNDYIGHGALMALNNPKFVDKVSKYINLALDYIQDKKIQALYHQLSLQLNAKKWEIVVTGQIIPMEPYFKYKDALYMIDSYEKSNNKAYYLDYESGDKFHEKSHTIQQKYEALLTLAQNEKSISSIQGSLGHVFLEDKERLKKLLHVEDYFMPSYLYKELYKPVKELKKGIFHLQMEEGMGKSSFVQAIDRLTNNKYQQQFSNVNVRACYIQSYIPNQLDDVKMQLLEGLKKIEKDGEIKELRILENIPEEFTKQTFLEFLKKYQKIQEDHSGKKKLMVIFDGLDELHSSEKFIEIIPTPEELPDSVFLLFTSRTETLNPNFTKLSVAPFIYHNDCPENKKTINDYIHYRLNNTSMNAREIVKLIHDYRFIYVRNFINISILQNAKSLTLEQLITAYCNSLLQEYGHKYAKEIQKLLALLTNIPIPLSLEQISRLIYEQAPDYGLIGLLHDVRSWLQTKDINQTRTFFMSHDQIRNLFQAIPDIQKGLNTLESEWEERLKEEVSISKNNPNELLIILKYLKQLLPNSYSKFESVIKDLGVYYFTNATTSTELEIARDLLYQYIHTFDKWTEIEAVYTLECALRTSQFDMMIELQNTLVSKKVNKETIAEKLADPNWISIRTVALTQLTSKHLPTYESFKKTYMEIQRQVKASKHIHNPILFLQSERPKIEKVIQLLPKLEDNSFFVFKHLEYRFSQYGINRQYGKILLYGKKVLSHLSSKKEKQTLTLIEKEIEVRIHYLLAMAYFERFKKNLLSKQYDVAIKVGNISSFLMGQNGYEAYNEAHQEMLQMMDYYQSLLNDGEWKYAEEYLKILKNCYSVIDTTNISLNYQIEILHEMKQVYKRIQSLEIKLETAFENEIIQLINIDRTEEAIEFSELKRLLRNVESDDLDSFLEYIKEHPEYQTDDILVQLCIVKYTQIKNLSSIPSQKWRFELESLYIKKVIEEMSITEKTAIIICSLIAICEYEHYRSSYLSERDRYQYAQSAQSFSTPSFNLSSSNPLEQDLIERCRKIYQWSRGIVRNFEKKYKRV